MQPFSLLLGMGALTGLLLAGWRAPKKETLRYVDAGIWTLLGSLVGSRAATVAVNWGYYQAHISEIYRIWLGGLSGVGAWIGCILTIFILAGLWKLHPGLLADTLLPLAGTMTLASWLGCWVDRCAYGAPLNAWWALPAADIWGVLAHRVPVQLIGAISALVIIWLLDLAGKHLPVTGITSAIGLFGFSAVIFALSFLRIDPIPYWHGMRLDAWGAISLMLFSILTEVVLLLGWKFNQRS